MMQLRGFLVVPLLLLGTVETVVGQSQRDSARAGLRLRVHYHSHAVRPFAGVFVRSTPDTLYLVRDGSGAPEPIALADIRRLQQSEGERSNFWSGVRIGAIAGAGAGLAVGLTSGNLLEEGAEESAVLPALMAGAGALAGSIVGGLIGSMSRGERWGPMVWVEPSARTSYPSLRTGGRRIGIGVRLPAAGAMGFSR